MTPLRYCSTEPLQRRAHNGGSTAAGRSCAAVCRRAAALGCLVALAQRPGCSALSEECPLAERATAPVSNARHVFAGWQEKSHGEPCTLTPGQKTKSMLAADGPSRSRCILVKRAGSRPEKSQRRGASARMTWPFRVASRELELEPSQSVPGSAQRPWCKPCGRSRVATAERRGGCRQ